MTTRRPPPPPPPPPPGQTSASLQGPDGPRRPPRRRIAFAAAGVAFGIVLIFLVVQRWGRDGETLNRGAAAGSSAPSPVPSGCPSRLPSPPSKQQFPEVPRLRLEKGVDYWAVIFTACGDIKIDLLEKRAHDAVANFVFLARDGFYDGLSWNRVVSDFLIQSGDPDNDLTSPPDGPGYTISGEVTRNPKAYRFGAVGYINMGAPGFVGSQFFIVAHDLRGALRGRGEPAVPDRGQQILFGQVPRRFFGSVYEISRYEADGRGPGPAYIERIEIKTRERRS